MKIVNFSLFTFLVIVMMTSTCLGLLAKAQQLTTEGSKDLKKLLAGLEGHYRKPLPHMLWMMAMAVILLIGMALIFTRLLGGLTELKKVLFKAGPVTRVSILNQPHFTFTLIPDG